MLTNEKVNLLDSKFSRKEMSVTEFLNEFIKERQELTEMISNESPYEYIDTQISGLHHLMGVFALETMSIEERHYKI